MSSGSFNQCYVVCPYYVSDDGKKTIICEGYVDKSTVSQRFRCHRDFLMQMCLFCQNKNNYRKCEVFRMVDEKYEEN